MNESTDAEAPAHAARAAALHYDATVDRAPHIVAKGRGALADEIVRRAREGGVPIHESRVLVDALMQFELDQEIPPILYAAIAEVLVWAYELESKAAPTAAEH